ncbi:hypothetical protein BGM09_01305 [Streptomyces sp. CBMA29]|nr:hypothetical protein [Streptomyces sp. CBMA29]
MMPGWHELYEVGWLCGTGRPAADEEQRALDTVQRIGDPYGWVEGPFIRHSGYRSVTDPDDCAWGIWGILHRKPSWPSLTG